MQESEKGKQEKDKDKDKDKDPKCQGLKAQYETARKHLQEGKITRQDMLEKMRAYQRCLNGM